MKNWNIIKPLRFIIPFCIVFSGLSQKITSHSQQQWIQYYNQLKLSKKLILCSDFGLRTKSNFNTFLQLTTRTGIGYPIVKKIQGITGLACFVSFKDFHTNVIEWRPYQELNTKHHFKKIDFHHRLRFEFRTFKTISNSEDPFSNNFRFRYRFFCTIPIFKWSQRNPDKKIYLNIGEEIFLNAGKEIKYNIFDNNRILLGSSLQLNNNLTFTLTYCHQYGHRNAPSHYEQSNILWLGITHKIGFKDKTL